jgi:hypothetical protein
MRLRWRKTTRWPRWPLWAVGLVLAWAAAIGVLEFVPSAKGRDGETICWFHRVTHVPCPTCGSTRGVRAVLDGRPLQGWACNPLVLTLLAGSGAYLAVRLASGWAPRLETTRRERLGLWVLLGGALAANWAYVICVLP